MIIKTNLLEQYINFVDNTKKQNSLFKRSIILFVNILCLFSLFILFENISKKYSYNYKKTSTCYYTLLKE